MYIKFALGNFYNISVNLLLSNKKKVNFFINKENY